VLITKRRGLVIVCTECFCGIPLLLCERRIQTCAQYNMRHGVCPDNVTIGIHELHGIDVMTRTTVLVIRITVVLNGDVGTVRIERSTGITVENIVVLISSRCEIVGGCGFVNVREDHGWIILLKGVFIGWRCC
jgi:hypothetical protein